MLKVKYCKYCKTFFETKNPNQKYTCGKEECRKLQKKEYYKDYNKKHEEYRREKSIEWQKNNPERFKEIQDRWRKNHHGQWLGYVKKAQKNWIKKNPEKHNKSIQKWRKTENGRKYEDRHNRRKGHVQILPNIFEDCIVDRHHIEKEAPLVIPMPRNIHLRNNSWRSDEHFIKNNEFIEKMYMIKTDIFLGRF
jgi:hypothetical protein